MKVKRKDSLRLCFLNFYPSHLLRFGSVKAYGVFSSADRVICVKPVEICMNNFESKKKLLALQKSKIFSSEIQDALRFAIEKLSDGEYQRCWCMDAVFTPAVMDLVPEQAQGKACICAKCASH